ncbi:MAG: hypothetical protein GY755_13320 [Chloroflexi bacterium]|nr:hypothetical protein [Chloroflexota bacterium]
MFIPSLRPDLIQRPHLVKKINQGLDQGMIFISAPAGFGKSTLITEWAVQSTRPVGWISLDETENDPISFLTYLVASIQTVIPEFGKSITGNIQSPGMSSPTNLAISMINELVDVQKHFAVVLDDFHLISDVETSSLIKFLIEHQPPAMQLIIASRKWYPTYLARLIASGEMIHFSDTDLRFEDIEVSEFLKFHFKKEISEPEVAALNERIEGWIAGLNMLVLPFVQSNKTNINLALFLKSNRYVSEYFVEEILENQPKNVQNFLMVTSILGKFNGEICNYLLGIENSQEIVDKFDRNGVFVISLDDDRIWFRYHHLFAELLSNKFAIESPTEKNINHLKASNWLEQNEFYEDAIEQAFQAGSDKRIAELLRKYLYHFWIKGQTGQVIYWLRQLPPAFFELAPDLFLIWADSAQLNNDFILSKTMLTRFEEHVDLPSLKEATSSLYSYYLNIKAFCDFFGNGPDQENPKLMIRLLEESITCHPEGQEMKLAFNYMGLGIAFNQAGEFYESGQAYAKAAEAIQNQSQFFFVYLLFLFYQSRTLYIGGVFDEARRICLHLLAIPNLQVNFPGILGIANFLLGLIQKSIGDYISASEHFNVALQNLPNIDAREILIAANFNRIICLTMVNYVDEAKVSIADMERMVQSNPTSKKEEILLRQELARIEADAIQLDFSSSMYLIEKPFLCPDDYPHNIAFSDENMISASFQEITKVKHYRRRGKWQEVETHLLLAKEYAESSRQYLDLLEVSLQEGLLAWETGNKLCAKEKLWKSICQAALTGSIHQYLIEGAAFMQPLFEFYPEWQGTEDELILSFLEHLNDRIQTQMDSELLLGKATLVFGLTNREHAVLCELARGNSNALTATKLNISENTLRTHIKRIYRKMGAKNRTQALEIGRKSGIVSH